MRLFTELLRELGEAEDFAGKERALAAYFRKAEDADAAWAVWLLSGGRPKRVIDGGLLIALVTKETRLPDWLVAECVKATKDEGETASLLLGTAGISSQEDRPGLAMIMERRVPAAAAGELTATWRNLSEAGCLLFHRLITGRYRAGSWLKPVTSVLAETANVSKSAMAVRLSAMEERTLAAYRTLVGAATKADSAAMTYPFCEISLPIDRKAKLELTDEWLAFPAVDGIRAQFVKRAGVVLIWTEEDQLVSAAVPELARAAGNLPDGTVLEGVLAAAVTDDRKPRSWLPSRLSRHGGRPQESADCAVVFRAHDILERNGADLRAESTAERLRILHEVLDGRGKVSESGLFQTDLFMPSGSQEVTADPLVIEAELDFSNWEEIENEVSRARKRGERGVLLKRNSEPYGDKEWQLWKPEPLRIAAVLVAVRSGRAAVGYTFAVWQGKELASVAAVNGPRNEVVDAFAKENTIQRHGPVKEIDPKLVFELEFDGIEQSARHKSGVVLRAPRILALCEGTSPDTAISLAELLERAGCRAARR